MVSGVARTFLSATSAHEEMEPSGAHGAQRA